MKYILVVAATEASGASIRSQKHTSSWSFAGSQGNEGECFDTLGVSGTLHRDLCYAPWDPRQSLVLQKVHR